ncbi:Protein RIC-3 [Merluccius polli]|uniref:Protein RIC-3 n=1 Tax=Merluccius polli TaxID=89951 RepID=A0AA47NRK5_MERPO|nr:Protein RIC-3 [Merluccius polli]
MSMSTFQKVTLATCLLLCVALLLPKMLLSRGKKDADRPEGHFPPMTPRQMATDGKGQRPTGAAQFSRAHNTEAIARAKGVGTGPGTGGKSNLAGQIIPIYGFGILLYILYILFKKELTTGPQTLIVGDGAVNKTKHFFSKTTKVPKYQSFTNDMVSDISEKILEITAEHPTVKSLVIHTGALDVVKQQSEVLKQDFNDLLNKVRCLNTEVFISGPLPTVRRGDERFSRLLMLNRWLKDTCAAQSVNFIDNFNIFWERRHLFEADGFCLNKSGITSKGSSKSSESRFPPIKSENTKRKITDFELAQLQERLRETEQVMENIVSDVNHGPHRVKGVSADQEENLLLQLREITRAMQEGHLREVAPRKTDHHHHHSEDDPKDFGQYCPYHHEHAAHSSPQTEPGDSLEGGADPVESNISQYVEDKAEGDNNTLNTDEVFSAAKEATADVFKPQGGEGGKDLEVPQVEEDLHRLLQELELETEKTEDLQGPAETPTAGSIHIRRRNRRRKGKKDSH